MDIQIRPFISQDWESYLAMSREFFSSDAVMHPIPEGHFRSAFRQSMAGSPYVNGLMLLADGRRAGYALLGLTWSNEAGGLSVLLEEAYIQPQWQGKGLGSALFGFLEAEYVNRREAKRLRLEVTNVNEGAIRLYERQGFQRLDYIQMIKDYDVPDR